MAQIRKLLRPLLSVSHPCPDKKHRDPNEGNEISGQRDQGFKPGSFQFIHRAVLSTTALLQFKPVLQHGSEERQAQAKKDSAAD
jgi:hypothetical protein